jgi:cell division protein FtsZ
MEDDLDAFEAFVKIMVIGVGGGGSNAVNQMLDDKLKNIDFWVFNTDKQALATSKSPNRLVLGEQVTKGLGAGGDPRVGKQAAEASKEQIKSIVTGYDMVFIAAGEGGGTGTGAAPVVAQIAREAGALTVAIVTRPFTFEGNARIRKATAGLEELKKNVDSIIIISNDRLMFVSGKSPLKEAFGQSDKVLAQAVKTITDLILLPGLINLDFADVRNTLKGKGLALIGFGEGKGKDKAKQAATEAIASPLLEASIKGAKSAIVNITGGTNVTLQEASDAVRYITEVAGGDVNIIFGVQSNPQYEDTMLVSVIATDFDEKAVDEKMHDMSILTTRAGNAPENPSAPIAKEVSEVEKEDKTSPFGDDDSILPGFFRSMKEEKKAVERDEEKKEVVSEEHAQAKEEEPKTEQTSLDFTGGSEK